MEAIHLDILPDKKRQSGDYGEREDAIESYVTSATQALRPQYKKHGLYPLSSSTSSSHPDPIKAHQHHKRTPSSQLPSPIKKTHGRQGSLPHNLSFYKDTNSIRYATPLLSEKNVSIQIADPSSNVIQHHILKHENTLQNLMYILLWYMFSTSLSLYNKNLMGRDRFNFNFPLLVSAMHALLHAIITGLMMTFGGDRWRSPSKVSMTMSDYFLKVVPCGVAAAIEICCSNASLVFITLSFYTMVKSSTPVWVLLFSFIFGFEKPRLVLITIIVVMVVGVSLTVEGETKFDRLGFGLVLVAAIVSGLRWNLTQLLLQQDRLGMNNPIATLYYLSPVMFITMLSLSLLVENPIDQFKHSKHFDSLSHVIESFGLMSIGGVLAFCMTLAELYLIKSTNTVTLSVAGISKEIVIITLSVLIYGDVLSQKTLIGLFISIVGIIAYNYNIHSRKKAAMNSKSIANFDKN